jgi:hypothetical protein
MTTGNGNGPTPNGMETDMTNILKSFDLVHTGGGCTALQFVLDDNDSIYVTDADGEMDAPTDSTTMFLVAIVDEDGNELSMDVHHRHDLTKEIEKLFDEYNVFRR